MRYLTRQRTAYQAARFERREELRENEASLIEHGIRSHTKWLHIETDPTGTMTDVDTLEEKAHHALVDIENVLDCDFMIYYSEELDGSMVPALWARGGRHVEFGIALMVPMHIVVIGPPENIFHWHQGKINGDPQIMHFDALEDFLKWYDANNVLPDDAEFPDDEKP